MRPALHGMLDGALIPVERLATGRPFRSGERRDYYRPT
jgi:hypothetical protein